MERIVLPFEEKLRFVNNLENPAPNLAKKENH
jgi:hypothetical protein